jgi:precorrin-6B methylase 2
VTVLRELIERYYGGACEILTVRRSVGSSAHLFVVDTMLRARPLRMLGTVGREGAVMEHSTMDLLAPERLVFTYERMMLVAFALAAEPASVLMLGFGGGAMSRHLAAYLPQCAVTAVERDRVVIDLARTYFHNKRPVHCGDAEDFVADTEAEFDVVLVDVYDVDGSSPLPAGFWTDCKKALRPDGCVAINWANSRQVKRLEDSIARVTSILGGSFLLVERGRYPNIIQLAPTAAGIGADGLEARWRGFARKVGLPREDRDILQRATLQARFPARRPGGKLRPKLREDAP